MIHSIFTEVRQTLVPRGTDLSRFHRLSARDRPHRHGAYRREASLLNISRTQPIADIDRWVWSDKETLFEYSRIIANAALHEYTYTYDIDEEASK